MTGTTASRTGHQPLPAPLPAGYSVRGATVDDLPDIAGLVQASEVHDMGEVDYTLSQLEEEFRQKWFDPRQDSWLVLAPDDTAVGFAELQARPGLEPDAFGWVHPAHRERGIGRLLLRLAEHRARELIGIPERALKPVVAHWVLHAANDARSLVQEEGYVFKRAFYRMGIRMQELPAAPEWPEGVELRTFEQGKDDREVYDTVTEAFQDHWNNAPRPFEEWIERRLQRTGFDPSLWFLAVADGRIVGASLCDTDGDFSIISTVAVLRDWRKRGIALALLLHSLREFHRRGRHHVVLSVDSESLTGATRVYERAGMHVEHQFDRYEKALERSDRREDGTSPTGDGGEAAIR